MRAWRSEIRRKWTMEELREIEADQALNAEQIRLVRNLIRQSELHTQALYQEHYELMQQGEMINYNLRINREVD